MTKTFALGMNKRDKEDKWYQFNTHQIGLTKCWYVIHKQLGTKNLPVTNIDYMNKITK